MTTTTPSPEQTSWRRATLVPALLGALTLLALTACVVSSAGDTLSPPPAPIVATASPDPQPNVTIGPGTQPRTASNRPPAQANSAKGLDAALRKALAEAAGDARSEGIVLHVNSGRRTVAEQELLLREAIDEYGSQEEARRWVATPDTSPHVSGDAVDIGPTEAARWLENHGTAYGLCQIYRNEPWHFELRTGAPAEGCPALFEDPTEDPRMQP